MKFVLLALLLFSAMAAFGQEHPAVSAQANTIYVGADGKFESAPDTAQIQCNVSVQEDTSQAVLQHASKNVEQVRQVLRNNGIDPKAANIGFLSVQPAYEWKPKQRVIGCRVTTDVGELSYASIDTFENSHFPMPRMAHAMTAMANAAPPGTDGGVHTADGDGHCACECAV